MFSNLSKSLALTVTFTPPVDLVIAHTGLIFSTGVTHYGVDIYGGTQNNSPLESLMVPEV